MSETLAALPFPTTDAQKWAAEFVRLHGGDEELMFVWFANAIEHGRGPDRGVRVGDEGLRAALPVLDWSYGKKPTYDVAGGCLTCGQRFTVRREKGVKPPLSVECPSCGCTDYGWRAATPTPPKIDVERNVLLGYFGQHEIDGPCDCGSCAQVRSLYPGWTDRAIAAAYRAEPR